MGRSTNAVVVPYKIDVKYINDIIERLSKSAYKYLEENPDADISATMNGWTFYFDCGVEYKDNNKNTLYCNVIEKDNIILYSVNEAQYAAGGDVWRCIFGKDKNAIDTFCTDFGINNKVVTSNNTVSQTL